MFLSHLNKILPYLPDQIPTLTFRDHYFDWLTPMWPTNQRRWFTLKYPYALNYRHYNMVSTVRGNQQEVTPKSRKLKLIFFLIFFSNAMMHKNQLLDSYALQHNLGHRNIYNLIVEQCSCKMIFKKNAKNNSLSAHAQQTKPENTEYS